MAGYTIIDENSGEEVHLMYEYPWVVCGQQARRGVYDQRRWDTLAAFRTEAQAQKWLTENEAGYREGNDPHIRFKIENWNA